MGNIGISLIAGLCIAVVASATQFVPQTKDAELVKRNSDDIVKQTKDRCSKTTRQRCEALLKSAIDKKFIPLCPNDATETAAKLGVEKDEANCVSWREILDLSS
jgi:hypothetical protein